MKSSPIIKVIKRHMADGFTLGEIVTSLSQGFGSSSDVAVFKRFKERLSNSTLAIFKPTLGDIIMLVDDMLQSES